MILSGSGGTIRLTNDQPLPEHGFYVGGGTRKSAGFIGWWVDSTTGLTHLDWVNWLGDRENAEYLGRKRGEIAIFDVAANAEIRLG